MVPRKLLNHACLSLLSVAMAHAATGTASAACTSATEQQAFRRALRDTVVCGARRARSQDETCRVTQAPPCAESVIQTLNDLLGGLPVASPTLHPDAGRCQVAAYRASRKFLIKRLNERSRGQRQQRRSAAALRLRDRCDLIVQPNGASTLPRFGGACTHLTGTAGKRLTSDSLRSCLRPELEKIVNTALDLAPVRPNVLLIVTDDQHPRSLNDMPNVMQTIAAEGVHFVNAFTITPICAPSRAGILTGQGPHRTTVTANQQPSRDGGVTNGALNLDDRSTLAAWFRASGYRTALHGKYLNGYSSISPDIPHGWDDWRVFVSEIDNFFDYDLNENGTVVRYGTAPTDYSTDVITDHALRFVSQDPEQPFFLKFAPFAPHEPSTPAPRHQGGLAGTPLWRPPSWGASDLEKPGWFLFFGTPVGELAKHDARVQAQRESLLSVDEAVAAILTRLEDLGLIDNTIVVFTSDHGILWGEHRWTTKQVAYEESIRIPMAIRYPIALPYGETRDELVLNIDIAPTLASLARVPAGHTFDGRSLAELWRDETVWRADFLIEHFEGGFTIPPWKALRSDRYKYVRDESKFEELYDLEGDPNELFSIASDPALASVRAAMSARMDEILGLRDVTLRPPAMRDNVPSL